MLRDPKAYLWDIQRAVDAILKFVTGLDAEIYAETDVVHSAVERKFEIIGEALSQLSKLDPTLARRIPDIRQIIAFRNLLIHGYATIDHRRVWQIAHSSLPDLTTTVGELMRELEASEFEKPRDAIGSERSAYTRYIGIDYSGAQSPTTSLKGLRVYVADRHGPPQEVPPPISPRKYWTRRGIAEWLGERLSENTPTIVGIDHGFSFPLAYFKEHAVPLDWDAFLDDFQHYWPTDGDHVWVDFVRKGSEGRGAERSGNTRWRRTTERRAGAAKSVFHFDVQGSVAKSTHSGIPWLRRLRREFGSRVHFWPFDGWSVPGGRSTLVEVYPSLWSSRFPSEERTPDQHDAYCVAMWMAEADGRGELVRYLTPNLPAEVQTIGQVEGWILGVS